LFLSENTLLYQKNFFFRFEVIDDNVEIKNFSGRIDLEKNSIKFVRDEPSPRFIKSHMPLELLPTVVNSTCKVCLQSNKSNIYLYRHYIYKNEKKNISFEKKIKKIHNSFFKIFILNSSKNLSFILDFCIPELHSADLNSIWTNCFLCIKRILLLRTLKNENLQHFSEPLFLFLDYLRCKKSKRCDSLVV